MKNHFIIPYSGNKRREVENIFIEIKDYVDGENIKTIIEPFCGTSAMSYFISLKYPKKFKYILNDNNQYLIELYEICRDENKLNDFIKEVNLLLIDIDKIKYNTLIKLENVKSWFIKNKIYQLRPGLFPSSEISRVKKDISKIKNSPIINFLRTENIEFTNICGTKKYNEFKNDSSCLIFLDPPYIMSCNDFYLVASVNIYEELCNNKIKNNNALIVLCLEKNWIIELLFKDYNKIYYDKKYEITYKKTQHMIIKNK